MEYTIKDVEREVKGAMAEAIKQEMLEDSASSYFQLVFEAGHWLGVKMREEGATDSDVDSACFALGQRIRMGGVPYKLAIDSLQRWRKGYPDKGGYALGRDLINGVN